MSLPPLAVDTTSIVVTGSFKPIDINPNWLKEQDLIDAPDVQKAQWELLVPGEAAVFSVDWFRCQANAQSVELQTAQEPEFERLRDLAVGILLAMPEKPIAQMGINRRVHFTINDKTEWHAIGDRLVNNEVWRNVLHLPGMRSVTFTGARDDGYSGRINVQVEPSVQFNPGIFVSYNDHYDLTTSKFVAKTRDDFDKMAPDDSTASTDKISAAVEILNDNWSRSTRLFYKVMEAIDQLREADDE